MTAQTADIPRRDIIIPSLKADIKGDLTVPDNPKGVIIFAHGIGSDRKSPRNRYVAEMLFHAGFAGLLIDLYSEQEAAMGQLSQKMRGDFIPMMAGRLNAATEWALRDDRTAHLPIGYYGASAGAAAALAAALQRPQIIGAIVCRGGRPDLVGRILPDVQPPTLLIVGEQDSSTVHLNRHAMEKLKTEKQLVIVPGASHLFEEPGALEEVGTLTKSWFQEHLVADMT